MPVKVRCQSCEKVFAAPDAARGKLVKCPGCEEKVKVPAGDGAKSSGGTKAPAKKPAKKKDDHDDHEHALKSLDLDKVEDENARVCPKCGQEIYDEETFECPACGLNFETGLTKEKARGVDPNIFYKVVLKDSKQFVIENKPLAIRTGIYMLVFSLVHFGCVFMVTWCVSPPPRMFWMGLAVITAMVPNGWLWFLNSEVIKTTMDKKERMPRVNFDMFTCVALGIKLLVWQIVMGAQLVMPLVAGQLFRMGLTIPGMILEGLTQLVLFLMLPQVMIHMVMPVTTRGWLAHIQFKAWAKSFGACAYWCAITFVVVLPSLLPAAIAGAIGYRGAKDFVLDMTYNFKANATYGNDMEDYYAKVNNPKKGEAAPIKPDEKDPKYVTRPIAWKGIIIPAIGIVLSQLMMGFSAVFAMRANGLFGLYFKKYLKLETMAKEVKWVAKGAKDDDPAVQKKKDQQKLIQNIVAVIAFLVSMGGVYWWMTRKPAGETAAPQGQQGDPAAQPGAGSAPPAGGVMPGGAPPGGVAPANPAGAAALAPPM